MFVIKPLLLRFPLGGSAQGFFLFEGGFPRPRVISSSVSRHFVLLLALIKPV